MKTQRSDQSHWLSVGIRGIQIIEESKGRKHLRNKLGWKIIQNFKVHGNKLKLVTDDVKISIICPSVHRAAYLYSRSQACHKFSGLLRSKIPQAAAHRRSIPASTGDY